MDANVETRAVAIDGDPTSPENFCSLGPLSRLRLLYRFCDGVRHALRLRTWDPDHALGRRGEDIAHRFLADKGFLVVARNFRTRTGSAEVDIIAWEDDALVFVEVKSRRSEEFGSPERAMSREKQANIVRGASEYLHRTGRNWDVARFDIVTVVFEPELSVRHIRNAFRAKEEKRAAAVSAR